MNSFLRTAALLTAMILVFLLCSCAPNGSSVKQSGSAKGSSSVSSFETPGQASSVADPPEVSSLHIDPAELPRIDGATAMFPFYRAAAAKLTGLSEDDAAGYISCSKTDNAYYFLTAGNTDLIFCALPSKDQVQAAAERGVSFETVDVLNSGFVFFVNKDNPITSLRADQIRDIYAGKITNWKDVGGNDAPIVAFQRGEGSGSQTGLYLHVISEEEVMQPPTELVIGDMGEIIDQVAAFDSGKNSFGYSYYYYITNMHYDEDVKLIAVDGVVPNPDTISKGEYPFISKACAVFRSDEPADSIVRAIVDWCSGEEGHALAEELGYVPSK